MKNLIILILCLWTVSESYCQVTDTLCVSKQRALELIEAEINYTKSLSVDSQQIEQIKNLETQVNFNEEKVNDCMVANDALSRANQYAKSEIEVKDKRIVQKEKEADRGKLTTKIASGIGAASLLFNMFQYLLK